MEQQKEQKPLEIQEGTMLEVIMPDEQVLFCGRAENISNDTFFLVEPDGKSAPPANFGAEVKLRCTLTDGRIAVYHGTVLGSRESMWKIGEVCDWYGWNRRHYFRQNLSVKGRVLRIKRAYPRCTIDLDMTLPCRLLDISASGVLFASSQCKYFWGDHLHILNATLIPGEKPFSFTCEVKRIENGRHNSMYGCEFLGMDDTEQDRLISAIFQLQLDERRRLANNN